MAAVSGPSLVNTIETELQRVKDDLRGVDENLRRLTGRDFTENRPDRKVRLSTGSREDEPPPKRSKPPGGVFARLGAVVAEPPAESRGRRVQEVLDDDVAPKPSIASSVARPVGSGKSRNEAVAELTKDRESRDRNRRMFGALLGTLQRFKTDEAKQRGKEEQRAAIERKLEEKGRAEKEELKRERINLFNQRRERQAQIRRLTYKMARVKEHEAWEAYQRKLIGFIRTRATPRVFWIPRTQTPKTSQLVLDTQEAIESELEAEQQQLKEELEELLLGRGSNRDEDLEEEEEDAMLEEQGRGRGSQSAEGKGGTEDTLDNVADLLDYEAEEGEIVFEENELMLTAGKTDNPERMVVQVARSEGGGGEERIRRKVELVGNVCGRVVRSADDMSCADQSKRVASKVENDSEKENVRRERRESEKSKDRVREKERTKDKGREDRKNKEKDRHRHKDGGEAKREKDKSKERRKVREVELQPRNESVMVKERKQGSSSKDTEKHMEVVTDTSQDKMGETKKKENKQGALDVRSLRDVDNAVDVNTKVSQSQVDVEADSDYCAIVENDDDDSLSLMPSADDLLFDLPLLKDSVSEPDKENSPTNLVDKTDGDLNESEDLKESAGSGKQEETLENISNEQAQDDKQGEVLNKDISEETSIEAKSKPTRDEKVSQDEEIIVNKNVERRDKHTAQEIKKKKTEEEVRREKLDGAKTKSIKENSTQQSSRESRKDKPSKNNKEEKLVAKTEHVSKFSTDNLNAADEKPDKSKGKEPKGEKIHKHKESEGSKKIDKDDNTKKGKKGGRWDQKDKKSLSSDDSSSDSESDSVSDLSSSSATSDTETSDSESSITSSDSSGSGSDSSSSSDSTTDSESEGRKKKLLTKDRRGKGREGQKRDVSSSNSEDEQTGKSKSDQHKPAKEKENKQASAALKSGARQDRNTESKGQKVDAKDHRERGNDRGKDKGNRQAPRDYNEDHERDRKDSRHRDRERREKSRSISRDRRRERSRSRDRKRRDRKDRN